VVVVVVTVVVSTPCPSFCVVTSTDSTTVSITAGSHKPTVPVGQTSFALEKEKQAKYPKRSSPYFNFFFIY